MSEVEQPQVGLSERERVILRRYREARLYPFTTVEARLYADSDIDTSDLRRLKRLKCPPETAARILL